MSSTHQPVAYRYVTVKRFSELSGRSEGSIRKLILRGHWLEGREYRRDPIGNINIDIEGTRKWVETETA